MHWVNSEICCLPFTVARYVKFLNNQQNKKDAPNENFAREVMELFTLGRGQLYRAGYKRSRTGIYRLEF